MTDEPYTLPESDAELLAQCDVHTFRSSGKGGQSVNTTDSAVRLVHRPTGITVVCRRERSQMRNRQQCIHRLRQRIEESLHEDPERIPRKTSRAAKRRRLDAKMRTASKKRLRRPPAED